MNPEELERLGSVVYAQSIRPMKKRVSKGLVIGFDTEFDSETSQLLAMQFSHKGISKFVDWRGRESLTNELLESETKKFLRENGILYDKKTLYLVGYWIIAEMQHLDLTPNNVEVIENAKTYTVKIPMKSGRHLVIFDLYPFFLTSLAKVAETFGLQKFDYDTSQISSTDLDKPQFVEYAINDAFICEEICIRFRQLILDEFGVDILMTKTPANTAMSAYRYNYVHEKIGQDWIMVRRMGLLCSWGGNNQAFKRGVYEGDFEEWDANSMYPNCAIQINEFPTSNSWQITKNLEDGLSSKGGFMVVKFSFPITESYPCLPVFEDGKLCYPLSGTSYCTTYEVKYALEIGATIEFIEGFHFTSGDDSLSRFLKHLREIKDGSKGEHEKAKRNMSKLLMNSIIGKLTQKKRVIPISEYKRVAQEMEIPVEDACKIAGLPVEHKILLGSGFMPEWNTLILGKARAIMARAYRDYGALLGTTDSMIITNPQTRTITIDGIEFKPEYKADKVAILRTRLYACWKDGKLVKCAEHGLIMGKEDASREILAGALGEKKVSTYTVKRPVKLREAWRRGLPFGVFIKFDRKSNLRWDGKRKLMVSGETRPLISVGEMYNENKSVV